MTDLTEFLLARIDEDRGAAQYLINVGVQGPQYGTINEALGRVTQTVLADVEAKRRIVEIHHRIEEVYPDPKEYCCSECSGGGDYPSGWPCGTLRALLTIYADHPDFRPEWAPTKETP